MYRHGASCLQPGRDLGTVCSNKYCTCLSLTDGGSPQHIPSVSGILHNPHYSQDFWRENTALLATSECQHHHYQRALLLPVFTCSALITTRKLCGAATPPSPHFCQAAGLTVHFWSLLQRFQGSQSTLTLSNSIAIQVNVAAFADTTSLGWFRSWKNQTISQARN